MIILEGMDGSGKSTLFRTIARALTASIEFKNVIMFPSVGAPGSNEEIASRIADEVVLCRELRIVTDRSDLISQYVYGGLNCEKRIVTLADIRENLNHKNTFLIQCDPCRDSPEDREVFKTRWVTIIEKKYFDGLPIKKVDAFDIVRQRYADVFRYAITPHLVYDWKKEPTASSVVAAVKLFLSGVRG